MIQLEGVYKIFGDRPKQALELLERGRPKGEIYHETGQVIAVQDVSIALHEEELFVIMGLSGSGKSTLLRCINRLVEPTSGKCYLKSSEKMLEITALNQTALRNLRRHQISMVFQNFALLPNRTTLANVALGLEAQGHTKKSRLETADRVLDLVGLSEWKNSYPHQLSGGMQQRVGLARALATEAKVLLMDEPFSALDPLIRYNMQELFMELQKRLKKTIFLVTHDLDEALRLGGRIAIMEEGRIVQVAGPEEIILNPRTAYVANFVKNADPTGVLTIANIALRVDADPALVQRSDSAEKGEGAYIFKSGDREISVFTDDQNRPVSARINDRHLSVEKMGEQNVDGFDNVFFSVCENIPIREVMPLKVNSPFPIIVVSDKGAFTGIVTEKEILQGLIKRGRFGESAGPGQKNHM